MNLEYPSDKPIVIEKNGPLTASDVGVGDWVQRGDSHLNSSGWTFGSKPYQIIGIVGDPAALSIRLKLPNTMDGRKWERATWLLKNFNKVAYPPAHVSKSSQLSFEF